MHLITFLDVRLMTHFVSFQYIFQKQQSIVWIQKQKLNQLTNNKRKQQISQIKQTLYIKCIDINHIHIFWRQIKLYQRSICIISYNVRETNRETFHGVTRGEVTPIDKMETLGLMYYFTIFKHLSMLVRFQYSTMGKI